MGRNGDRAAIVAATRLEATAARAQLVDREVYETGVALARGAGPFGAVVISCGLAGGLRPDIPSGTVLVPREVRRPDGSTLQCDRELCDRLEAAARSLGFEPVVDPLLTASELVNGEARARWAARGFAGVDMETGLLQAPRIAAVRVILDTPQHELSEDWLEPAKALRRPRNWAQALWLARTAPRLARRAAAVIAASQL